ncbi:MAG: hypothetical protein GWP10_13125 [Nitrospiraceae bacterium]|nr:hypothetical protein [Nitrospiraceae bacterium]
MLKKIWQLWKAFAHALGVVNTFVLLTLTYLLLIGPVGLVLRLIRRDVLNKKWFRKGAHWVAKSGESEAIETYTHPF